jgi:hypothetical protein
LNNIASQLQQRKWLPAKKWQCNFGPRRFHSSNTAMKRNAEESGMLQDASDRAQKLCRKGTVRIPLKSIGFWHMNRGGLGIASRHAHEVAHDVKTHKTNEERYGKVELVEIPNKYLTEVREANRKRCAADALMPRYSPEIKYICLTKTHFVHAQKLANDGNRSLLNQGKIDIVLRDDDTDGHAIQTHGPLCVIYDSKLFEDQEAMLALASQDNLNADVQMAEE